VGSVFPAGGYNFELVAVHQGAAPQGAAVHAGQGAGRGVVIELSLVVVSMFDAGGCACWGVQQEQPRQLCCSALQCCKGLFP
jgi:hypothetical protein